MHEDSCIGINNAHMFPKCFRSLHTHCWASLCTSCRQFNCCRCNHLLNFRPVREFLVEIHTAKTGLLWFSFQWQAARAPCHRIGQAPRCTCSLDLGLASTSKHHQRTPSSTRRTCQFSGRSVYGILPRAFVREMFYIGRFSESKPYQEPVATKPLPCMVTTYSSLCVNVVRTASTVLEYCKRHHERKTVNLHTSEKWFQISI